MTKRDKASRHSQTDRRATFVAEQSFAKRRLNFDSHPSNLHGRNDGAGSATASANLE